MNVQINKSRREIVPRKIDILLAGVCSLSNFRDLSIGDGDLEIIAHSIRKNEPPISKNHQKQSYRCIGAQGSRLRSADEEPIILCRQFALSLRHRRKTMRNSWWSRFAVRGVFWRQYLDWAMVNVPFYFRPAFLFFWTNFFFLFAAPARRAIVANLAPVFPNSWRLTNYFRAWRTMYNFAWTIADAADFKINKASFAYELNNPDLLAELAATKGAILLTAHMGNYDLGAAAFAQKFDREIRMVRAPEPDRETAEHLSASLEKTGEGGVVVDYNVEGSLLSFDLLAALRQGAIVSIQGDRVVAGVAQTTAKLFGHAVRFPNGPFILAQVGNAPIFPLFVVRSGYREYKIIVREPIIVPRTERVRDYDAAIALAQWAQILEEIIVQYWHQWFAFLPVFLAKGGDDA
jgi:phosphatidylinositol dimannoside acyltransferase